MGCLDPLLEITKVYIDSMRFIGFSRQFKPLHSKSNLQVPNFVQHLRQTEDPNEVVEDEDENAEEIDPSDRQIVFVRRFSEAEETYLRSKCCYPRQLKLADNYWLKIFQAGQQESSIASNFNTNASSNSISSLPVVALKLFERRDVKSIERFARGQ